MRVGLVCPYPWDLPGGVAAHVRDLAEALIGLGHSVGVIAPLVDADHRVEPWVTAAGSPLAIPFNGSVARLALGPTSVARVRRWVRDGHYDVLHVHSPEAPSLGMLACLAARGPIVATFHSSNPRSRVLQLLSTPFQTQLEKITGRIAVSPAARRTVVEHLGGDAVVIPNGVWADRFAAGRPLPGWPRPPSVGFLGRLDEPRKGFEVLARALPALVDQHPEVQLLVAGPGDLDAARRLLGEHGDRVTFLGLVSDADKIRFLHSVDVYCAPNTGGESFGVVLVESLAAGTPVVASDLDAFGRVLQDGRCGVLAATGDADALTQALADLLADTDECARLTAAGQRRAARYDWSVVAEQVLDVYETVAVTGTAVIDTDVAQANVAAINAAATNVAAINVAAINDVAAVNVAAINDVDGLQVGDEPTDADG